jgi:hypothetical protein
VHELAVAQAAAVGDEVDLREARDGDVPAIGLEGDVVLEQGARLGPPVQPLGEPASVPLTTAGLLDRLATSR